MKHLKKFETVTAYNAAILDLPNVSLIEENISVSYKPYVPETRVVAKYNVTSTSNPIALRTSYEQNIFKSMEIDDVILDELVTEYTFSTTGVHTVKYELYDETKLGNQAPVFNNIDLVECIIPDNVTIIGDWAFNGCGNLTSVTIGSGVTSIGSNAFNNCSCLSTITSYIMNAPSVSNGTFSCGNPGGTLYVPIGSSGYETWMNDSGNLGFYNWTKVEQ